MFILKDFLFKKVKCKGFYAKKNDGNYLILDSQQLVADHYNSNFSEPVEKDVDGIEKVYYEHRDQNFKGAIVGRKKLITVGYLDVIYDEPIDTGLGTIPERFYIDKRPKEIRNVYIVYYANNLKHYVDENDIVEEYDE